MRTTKHDLFENSTPRVFNNGSSSGWMKELNRMALGSNLSGLIFNIFINSDDEVEKNAYHLQMTDLHEVANTLENLKKNYLY